MKGFGEVTIQNRPCVIEYKGEHYVVRYLSGRTVRMAKAAIIKKFHLHHDALDRYVAGGFKKPHCNANEDVVLVKRSKNDVENVSFFITSAIVMTCGAALILAVVLGYVDKQALRPYIIQMISGAFTAMFLSVEIVEYLADEFDFVLGIEREG
jgi:hypothetical protein